MNSTPLRWGILSTGKIAHRFARALNTSLTGKLVAVASRSEEMARAFANQHGAPHAHGDYTSLLANPEVDAIYIATPHPMHLEWVLKCAAAGKHILCEKPAGMNRAEVEAMIAAAKTNGIFFMEAFMYRCHPQTQLLRKLIRSGEIGTIRMIHASFSYYREQFDPTDRLFARTLGGGSILDVGCYGVSMARLVAGEIAGKCFAEPLQIKGFARIEPIVETDLTAAALLQFEDGLIAMIQSGLRLQGENCVLIEGETGSITVGCPWALRHGEAFLKVQHYKSGETRRIDTTKADEDLYGYEIDEVAWAVTTGEHESPDMSWADSLGNATALDAWLAEAGITYETDNGRAHSRQ
ncbi:MAG: Gfo/Idh/MocA family oxidoreductase [bacterium]